MNLDKIIAVPDQWNFIFKDEKLNFYKMWNTIVSDLNSDNVYLMQLPLNVSDLSSH